MRLSKRWFSPLVVLATAMTAGTVQADTGNAGADVILPLALTEDATLQFGQISGISGTVVISSAGARSVTGSVVEEGGTFRAATWTVTGEPSTNYDISYTAGSLTGPGTAMTIDTFTDSKGGTSALDGSGDDSFTVGATLTVGSPQTAGTYAGTYTITVAYQ